MNNQDKNQKDMGRKDNAGRQPQEQQHQQEQRGDKPGKPQQHDPKTGEFRQSGQSGSKPQN